MKEFLNYFKRQWYPRLPAQRTTNALEGWHRRVNGIIPPTPNLFHFIFKLHKEAKHADSRIQFTLFYKLKKNRRTIDILFDGKYAEYLGQLERQEVSILDFLKMIIQLKRDLRLRLS